MSSALFKIPTPAEQVLFLRNLQRLLSEGHFVASYKFALIQTLADIAVLKGDDTGAPLDIRTNEIAAKFVELYWRQSRPFQVGAKATGYVLQQNTGKTAKIISQIASSQKEFGGSLFRFKQVESHRWSRLVAVVDRVVRGQPLWKLQTVGKERLDFLYENLYRGNCITLKAGVAYCFRAFYELIRDFIEGAWLRFVQKLNTKKLGASVDLATFLFGQDRRKLDAYRPILQDIQRGACLYCGKALVGRTQVDHFVPWSRYPADIGHNLVLAHDSCNNAKSDFLAAENHLAAWVQRNRENDAELQERLSAAALPSDLLATVQIAKWVYRQAEKSNGQVWVQRKLLRHLTADWMTCFAA